MGKAPCFPGWPNAEEQLRQMAAHITPKVYRNRFDCSSMILSLIPREYTREVPEPAVALFDQLYELFVELLYRKTDLTSVIKRYMNAPVNEESITGLETDAARILTDWGSDELKNGFLAIFGYGDRHILPADLADRAINFLA